MSLPSEVRYFAPGTEPMRKKITPYLKKKIARLKAEGHTCAYIAKKIKRGYMTTFYYFNDEYRTIQLTKRYPQKKYADKTPEQKARTIEIHNAWVRRNRKKVNRYHRRYHHQTVLPRRYEAKKKLVIEIGKQLGLYENHR